VKSVTLRDLSDLAGDKSWREDQAAQQHDLLGCRNSRANLAATAGIQFHHDTIDGGEARRGGE